MNTPHDDIVKRLRAVADDPHYCNGRSCQAACLDEAADVIETLRKEREWVSVEERLPAEHDTVLGYFRRDLYRAIPGGYMQLHYRGGNWFDVYDDDDSQPPECWIPLPSPPEQKP